MARQPQPDKRPAPRLYLVTPPLGETNAFARELGQTVRAADVAAVLLRLKGAGERELVNRVKALASMVQETGAALVLDGHPDIAARAGADGGHLTGIAAFTAAVEGLRPARIAGCGGLQTRDDAMAAGENGADYVMFGEPEADGRRPSFAAILERIEWWAEVFEIPCVGFAATLDEVGPLAAAGADFVALGESIWDDPRGPAAAVADAATRLGVPEPAQ
ncbi:MAG: thiamine phosphate synthase [Xanthobacteraceae bacterium]|nr:thiamine phosphate synthase [Xanthobacteraceae bacterium]